VTEINKCKEITYLFKEKWEEKLLRKPGMDRCDFSLHEYLVWRVYAVTSMQDTGIELFSKNRSCRIGGKERCT